MSFRTRLSLYYAGFFSITLLLLGCGIFFAVRSALENGVEDDLRAGARQVLSIYRAGGTGSIDTLVNSDGIVEARLRGELAQIFDNPLLGAQIFSPRGELIGQSPNLEHQQPPLPLPKEAFSVPADEMYIMMGEANGKPFAYLITPLEVVRFNDGEIIDKQRGGYIQITRPLDDVDETLKTLLFILLGGSGIALLITTMGVRWLSRRALAPIDQVTQTAQSIVHAEDLGQRVPVSKSQDELHRLTVTINDLLERFETIFTTQRRFVADVSHELRTPLAAMQGNLEVLSRGAQRDPALLDETISDMRRETTRLIRMVNDLLLLAQSDSRVEIHHDCVELDTLLLEVYRELRPLTNGVQLRIGAEDQVVVYGDRDRLKQALLNLGANALQHTLPGETVTLGLEQHDGVALLSVADTGEGIREDDLPFIFERFYRADRSRSRHRGGSGLGLSIVKRVAEAHGGSVVVDSASGTGSVFTLLVPLPPILPTVTHPAPVAEAQSLHE